MTPFGLPIPLWITRGVAVDFLVGRWTREHKDLDLVTLAPNRARIVPDGIRCFITPRTQNGAPAWTG